MDMGDAFDVDGGDVDLNMDMDDDEPVWLGRQRRMQRGSTIRRRIRRNDLLIAPNVRARLPGRVLDYDRRGTPDDFVLVESVQQISDGKEAGGFHWQHFLGG